MTMSMRDSIDIIHKILKLEGVNYTTKYAKDTYKFFLKFSLRNTKLSSINVVVNVVPNKNNPNECFRLTSHASIGIQADTNCMMEVAEFLHRANFGMIFGCFELDFNDGEIRFRMSINCKDIFPGPDAIIDLWVIPTIMTERYGNGLLAVSLGLTSARAAIQRIEG